MESNRSYGEKKSPKCGNTFFRLILIVGILLLVNCSFVSAAGSTGGTTPPAIQTLNITPAVIVQTLMVTPAPAPAPAPVVQNLRVGNPALEKAYIENKVMPMHNITTAQ